jgi:hypothetical protein
MHLKHVRRLLLAAFAALTGPAACIGAELQAAEFETPYYKWWSPSPRAERVPQPRSGQHSRSGDFEEPRRPADRIACVSLACPGFILLGVGF